MFTDITLPNKNEMEFADLAYRLGYKKLYCLYDFNEFSNIKKRLDTIENIRKISIEIGFIVNQKNLNEAVQHSKLLVVKSSDKDRFFIETKKIRLIYGFEELHKKDYLHQRASGLNHTLCELAKENNIIIGFSYSSLLNEDKQTSALLIGRMMQNIRMCQKYKVKTVIGSFSSNPYDLRSPHDIASLFSLFGMDGKRIKDSLNYKL